MLIVSCDGSDNSRLFDKSDYLYYFKNADYNSIDNYLSNTDWLTEFGASTSAADVWNEYCNHITFVLQQLMFGMCTVTTLPSFFSS